MEDKNIRQEKVNKLKDRLRKQCKIYQNKIVEEIKSTTDANIITYLSYLHLNLFNFEKYLNKDDCMMHVNLYGDYVMPEICIDVWLEDDEMFCINRMFFYLDEISEHGEYMTVLFTDNVFSYETNFLTAFDFINYKEKHGFNYKLGGNQL